MLGSPLTRGRQRHRRHEMHDVRCTHDDDDDDDDEDDDDALLSLRRPQVFDQGPPGYRRHEMHDARCTHDDDDADDDDDGAMRCATRRRRTAQRSTDVFSLGSYIGEDASAGIL